jgi:hypothetical protein
MEQPIWRKASPAFLPHPQRVGFLFRQRRFVVSLEDAFVCECVDMFG